MKKYTVRLQAQERTQLEQLVGAGKRAASVMRHASILLAVDASDAGAKMTDAEVAKALNVSVRSIEYLRQRCVLEGLDAALERKKRQAPGRVKLFDGEKEAKLIAIACGPKPQGRVRWTLELLADRVVKLKIVESCSPQTVMRVLKKRT
jgi:transposase